MVTATPARFNPRDFKQTKMNRGIMTEQRRACIDRSVSSATCFVDVKITLQIIVIVRAESDGTLRQKRVVALLLNNFLFQHQLFFMGFFPPKQTVSHLFYLSPVIS